VTANADKGAWQHIACGLCQINNFGNVCKIIAAERDHVRAPVLNRTEKIAARIAGRSSEPSARRVQRLRPQARVRAAPAEDKSSNTSNNSDGLPGFSFLFDTQRFVYCFGTIALKRSEEQNFCPVFASCYECACMFRSRATRRDVTRRLLDECVAILMLQQKGKCLWLENRASLRDLILKKA
jgi:hypothetical protein